MVGAFTAGDWRFLGTPVDFVIFDGLSDGQVERIVLVEVKSGTDAKLNDRQIALRAAVNAGTVRLEWLTVRGPRPAARRGHRSLLPPDAAGPADLQDTSCPRKRAPWRRLPLLRRRGPRPQAGRWVRIAAMTAARFARLVRFCDERYTTRADGLASAARHFEQSRFKSQSNDAEKRQSWPYRGLPLVAVGSHGARGLVMFGVCQSLNWAPNPDPSDAQMCDQYDAWRRAAEPVAYADEIEYITAPDGAARAV